MDPSCIDTTGRCKGQRCVEPFSFRLLAVAGSQQAALHSIPPGQMQQWGIMLRGDSAATASRALTWPAAGGHGERRSSSSVGQNHSQRWQPLRQRT